MKRFKHWLYYDTIYTDEIKKTLSEGSDFKIVKFYPHPRKFGIMVIDVESNNGYRDLDLEVNSGSSLLYRYKQKPNDLGNGLSLEQFESVYGKLE